VANATSAFYAFGFVGHEPELDRNVQTNLIFGFADEMQAPRARS
jgi:hypothetical protein